MTSSDQKAWSNGSVMENVRRALSTGVLPEAFGEHPQASQFVAERVNPEAVTPAQVEAFVTEVTELSGHVHLAAGQAEAVRHLLRLTRDYQVERMLTWSPASLPLADVLGQLRATGIRMLPGDLPEDAQARDELLALFDGAEMGLTGALAGIVDSGSLVVASGAGRPRLASLLPPVHVALLRRSDLCATMADFFAHHPGVTAQSSNLVFITGPSRTADIEQTLTLGVHGPRQLHIILLPD